MINEWMQLNEAGQCHTHSHLLTIISDRLAQDSISIFKFINGYHIQIAPTSLPLCLLRTSLHAQIIIILPVHGLQLHCFYCFWAFRVLFA